MKGSIIKRGNRYMGKVYNKYQKKYIYVYDLNEKECKKKVKDLIKNIELDPYNFNNTQENKNKLNMTVEEAFNMWIETKINCTKKTISDYISIKNVHFTPLLSLKIKDLNDKVIQKFYNDKLNNSNASTVHRIHKCLCAFVNYLYKRHIITTNYMDFIVLPKKEKTKHVYCSGSDYLDILNKLKECNYQLYMIVFIAGNFGLRLGEILGIPIENIDLKKNCIHITQQAIFEKGKGFCISKNLKTQTSYRTVYSTNYTSIDELKKFLVSQIIKIKKERNFNENFNLDNLLFFSKKGTVLPQNSIERYWRKFKVENNINPNLRIHDFRRYYATYLMYNNVPDKISKKLLGHSKINMTEYYQNDDDELVSNVISNIEFKIQK